MSIFKTEAQKVVDKFLKEDLIYEEAKIASVIMLNELIKENQAMGRLIGVNEEYMNARIRSLELIIKEVKKLQSLI